MAVYSLRRFLSVGAVLALTLLVFPARPSMQTPSMQAPSIQAPSIQAPYDAAGQQRDFSTDVPAHLTVVDGQVTLVRDGRLEPAEANQVVLAGDRLRTEGGRVEILFVDGSTVAVDEDTTLDLLSDSLVRLIGGRVRIAIPRATEDLDYRVDTASGFVEIRAAGEYRVQTGTDSRGKGEVALTVYRGSAELANDFGRTLVRAGRQAVTSADTEPSLPYAINSAAWDEFDRWVDNLRESRVTNARSASASYLPQETTYYANTLDAYGTWDYSASYGAIWYPTVAVGWWPYSQGRWSYTHHYGWTWLGIDRWAWPTYHYGRWGISTAGWYWIPGRQWGPAWVSWAVGPGYVGWCPTGFDGHPAIGFGWASPYHRDPWSSWTVMPARAMTPNVWVTEHRMRQDGLPANARNGFAERRVGPVPMGSDIPRREIAPLRAPTLARDVAVTRAGNLPAGINVPGAASVAGPVTGWSAPSRAPVATPQPRGAYSRVPGDARTTTQDGFPPTRAFPQTSVDTSRMSAPRAGAPGTDSRSSSPARAVPRQVEPAPIAPGMGADSTRTVRRAPEVYRGVPPTAAEPSVTPGRAVPRNPPPTYSAPPAVAPPTRQGPSYAPPPPSAPPSGARGRTVQPSAPPPAPPSRGGGGGTSSQGTSQGSAVPRRGGRGG